MADQSIAPSASCDSPVLLACSHRRVIDEVLKKDGKKSGQVRCIECGTVFDDPDRPLK
jgi:uncharacterized Zn finger protein